MISKMKFQLTAALMVASMGVSADTFNCQFSKEYSVTSTSTLVTDSGDIVHSEEPDVNWFDMDLKFQVIMDREKKLASIKFSNGFKSDAIINEVGMLVWTGIDNFGTKLGGNMYSTYTLAIPTAPFWEFKVDVAKAGAIFTNIRYTDAMVLFGHCDKVQE